MTDYYGKIDALALSADFWILSGMYVRGSISSNDLGIANKLTDALPPIVSQVASYVNDMHNNRKE